MFIYFKVNETCCEFELSQEEQYAQIMSDDTYAAEYIIEMIGNGSLKVAGTITKILRAGTLDDLTVNPVVIFEATENIGDHQNSDSQEWGEHDTKFLLAQVFDYLPNVGPQKRFKNKKAMWKQIAAEISTKYKKSKTDIQTENRYKTVLKRKKNAVDQNSTSGNSRTEVPFEEELRMIASQDDSIEPEVLRSAKGVKRLKDSTTGTNTQQSSSKVKKAAVTVADKLQQIHEKTEESRAQRHKEKMELVREMWCAKPGSSQKE